MAKQKSLTYRLVFQLFVASAFFLLFCQTITGAEIKIRGYIYDGNTNAPLSDAKAELQTNKFSALSNSSGFFSINQQTSSVLIQQVSDLATMIRISGSTLSFSVSKGAQTPVVIRAFNLNGRSIPIYNGIFSSGSKKLNLASRLHTPGVYLLQTSIGDIKNTGMIRVGHDGMALLTIGTVAGNSLRASESSNFAAAFGVWDTLIVSKSNYTTVKIALATSLDSIAMLTLKPNNVTPQAELIGFATVNGNTTGGGNATPTTVKTLAELKAAVADNNPRVIIVSGTIKTTDGGNSALQITSNKTIIGADKNAKIYGGIAMSGVNNVVVRNLSVQGVWPNIGPGDAVAVANSAHHIWLDHLSIWDAPDGNLDITKQANYVTVSWCKFWYTSKDHPHRLNGLIGAGGGTQPDDWGKLKVTYHHNWFADLVDQRMPRLMYGQAHVFNNYYTATGNSYCVGVGSYGAALSGE